ncbi:MAG: bifunctional phosphoribosylaminoimidazolecarboxamide formyltransferase/IMP cyclohydrolase, partial [Flavobacterium sp.]|nr:bifunctional phosphoribosylaminoimidazolecarboxamide formyltransferase/IMP cyclohydrolase [Flavobacterium sp.]
MKKITSALISVYHKDNLEKIAQLLSSNKVKIYSTGGTADFIQGLGIPVTRIEEVTSYPSILGGRVKTLHPLVFGGILYRRDNPTDLQQIDEYNIPPIDLVIVDLYPFEKSVLSGSNESEIIEKIDIGGISLIRAAAKNFKDVIICASSDQYSDLITLLEEKNGFSEINDRHYFAAQAFNVSSHYDTAIFNYFNKTEIIPAFKQSIQKAETLRYGENPHQKGFFYGNMDEVFEQIHGKAISYNNLLDIDAALALIAEFEDPTFAILKHNNACGLASRNTLIEAWLDALAGDPVSAFGGVLVANKNIDKQTAEEVNKLFFEVVMAPSFDTDALEILKSKKNRIILTLKNLKFPEKSHKSILNGILSQDKDLKTIGFDDFQYVTKEKPSAQESEDLIFANKIVKHTKSN